MSQMTPEQLDRMSVKLSKKGLYVINKEAIKGLREFGALYSTDVSLEEVRDITYKVWKKHKVTLSDEVKLIRGGQ